MAGFRTTLEIAASVETVFEHFVDPTLLVSWMGDWAELDPRPGGCFAVDINGVIIRGSYVRVERPHGIEIAWGEQGNPLMPPGATRLSVRLRAIEGGTRLELEHDGLAETEAEKHAVGWPHFLERLRVRAPGGDPGRDPWAA
jgi:uncharacterized protein YndB with AHSA1/START domain